MAIDAYPLPTLLPLRPERDERGWAGTFYDEREFPHRHFIQEFVSHSIYGTIRGLHYQVGKPQGKLIRVINGEVMDICVDVRRDSIGFGRYKEYLLDPLNMLWIPEGYAHGFQALTDVTMQYLFTEYSDPKLSRVLKWSDPTVHIFWRIENPIISVRDRGGLRLEEIETL